MRERERERERGRERERERERLGEAARTAAWSSGAEDSCGAQPPDGPGTELEGAAAAAARGSESESLARWMCRCTSIAMCKHMPT